MTQGVRVVSVTTKDQSDSDAEFLAAGERHVFMVYNDSDAVLYLRLGADAASATDYSVKLIAGAYFESPASYDGAVHGIFASSGAGKARITEIGA